MVECVGRDGLTHNMLELIHSHWKRQRVCKVRCRGVPTIDMNNVCRHLEVLKFVIFTNLVDIQCCYTKLMIKNATVTWVSCI